MYVEISEDTAVMVIERLEEHNTEKQARIDRLYDSLGETRIDNSALRMDVRAREVEIAELRARV